MYKYKVPATSANLGIGFDVLGIALNIYDYFEVEEASKYKLIGFNSEVSLKDNLFIKAYKKACAYKKVEAQPIEVKLKANVPISRGLGSSSCMIVGGIYACHVLNDNCFSKEEMLKIAAKLEGHPDNVAPAIYGGLCASNKDSTIKLKVSNKWCFGIFIPPYEVKTSEARKVLKDTISRNDAVSNISNAVIGLNALETFNKDNIKALCLDKIHEPYRKVLIKDYEAYKKLAYKKGALAFIISGSGSTCLSISDKPLNIKDKNINYKEVKVDTMGVRNV